MKNKLSPAAVTMVWRFIFNGEYGILNGTHIGWITDPKFVMISCAIVAIWSNIGYDAVLLLAGLQNIPKTLYEANTIFALVFPGIVSAFGVFFLRQTYLGIPKKIGEAAYLDSCNQWQTFYKVMFPLTGTSVAALTIFTAVFAYSDLMCPLVVNSDLNMMTLSSGLATLRGQFSTNFPILMDGSLLAMLPMVILYLIFQRQFIEGIASTGGK